MASDSRSAPADAARLAMALDAIEAALDRLEPGARPDVVANALAEPIRAFDAAAKEALR
jgi:hypothetical protein